MIGANLELNWAENVYNIHQWRTVVQDVPDIKWQWDPLRHFILFPMYGQELLPRCHAVAQFSFVLPDEDEDGGPNRKRTLSLSPLFYYFPGMKRHFLLLLLSSPLQLRHHQQKQGMATLCMAPRGLLRLFLLYFRSITISSNELQLAYFLENYYTVIGQEMSLFFVQIWGVWL